MRILVLDQATIKIGFVVVDESSSVPVSYGATGALVAYGMLKASPSLDLVDRLGILKNDINQVLSRFAPIHEMVVEDTRFLRQKNAKTNMAMAAAFHMCRSIAKEHGIGFYYQNPKSIKAMATGYGNADKADMIATASMLWGFPEYKLTDDIADALCAAHRWLVYADAERPQQDMKRGGKR